MKSDTGTWDFNVYFEKLKKHNLVNRIFFEAAILNENYNEVIVDEEGTVHGYLFGNIPGKAMPFQVVVFRPLEFVFKSLYHYVTGHLGPRRDVYKKVRRFSEDEKALLEKREKTDAYVNLFFISSALRGQGWGKKLMNNFAETSKRYGSKRIYLWTDLGCNYKFYDHTGFIVVSRINSPYLENPEEEFNGFTYVKPLS